MRKTFRFMLMASALGALSLAGAAGYAQSRKSAAIPRPRSRPTVVRAPKATPPSTAPVSLLNPDPMHPRGDLIEVSIKRQRLFAWRDGITVYRFIISTGRPGYDTPTGHYLIIAKYPTAWSEKWHVWMPWAMNWYGNYFIHQLPHFPGSTVNIGASKLGTPDSHGCIRVNVGDARTLFVWAAVGTPVWVH